jgi:hypothetical protein
MRRFLRWPLARVAAAGLGLLALSAPAVLAAGTDVLVLRNGDRIS